MNKHFLNLKFLLIVLLFTLFIPNLLIQKVYADTNLTKVYDTAGLLSKEEAKELEELCNTYGKENSLDIIIITTNSIGSQTRQRYMEDFYDKYIYDNSNFGGNCAMILVNMDPSDRGVEIQGYGEGPSEGDAEYYLNGARIDTILDTVVKPLKTGNYYNAFQDFIKEVDYYVGLEYSSKNSLIYELWFQMLISLGIGGITVAIMAYNSGGKVTVNSGTYLDHNHSRILAKRDDYIRTTVTRTKKPKNDDNHGGGGSGAGVSSGGHSHSGGGRGF